jgi:nucleotide-binding universal stress UspA family protein
MIRHPLSLLDGEVTGHASFPASDPPAAWTWDPPRKTILVGVEAAEQGDDAIALGSVLADLLGCELRVVGRADLVPTQRPVRAAVVASPHAARQLQTRAPWPVVLAPRGYASEQRTLRYVGCGFDTSAGSRAAWHEACALTKAASGELHVYAIREQHAFGFPGAPLGAGDLDEIDRELGFFLHRELLTLVATAEPRLCVEPVLACGNAESILRDAARSLDLLVVGASRHGPVGSFLLGSVARGLLREPPCPLMVVPG